MNRLRFTRLQNGAGAGEMVITNYMYIVNGDEGCIQNVREKLATCLFVLFSSKVCVRA